MGSKTKIDNFAYLLIRYLAIKCDQDTEADEHREPGEFNLAQNLIFQTFYCPNQQEDK